MSIIRSISRFVSECGPVFWLGGCTFHALLAIPAGHDAIGSRTIGFITQRVTRGLNLIGVGAIAILVVNAIVARAVISKMKRIAVATSLSPLVITLLIQLRLHPQIGTTLQASDQCIRDYARFRALHTLYEQAAIVQWFVGLAHLWLLLPGRRERPEAQQ